jgi:CO/xanthine dehydrogenase FAD-binding subunit
MKPFPFDYRIAENVDEALALLAAEGVDAKLVAGGQSLGPMLNYHLVRPDYLIDVNRIAELHEIRHEDGALQIGATTTEAAIEQSDLVRQHAPLLAVATSHIGFPSIRHRGTIGGSVSHNDPAAEYPATLLALDASFEVASMRGVRKVTATELFSDRFLETTIEPDEMITRITIPSATSTTHFGFAEFEERAGDFATAGVAVVLTMNDAHDQIVAAAISAFGGLYSTRFSTAEAALIGAQPGAEAFDDATAAVASEFAVGTDVHGSASYRRRLVRTLTRGALNDAATLQPAL